MSTPPRHLVLCEVEDPGIPGLESPSPYCLKVHRALRLAGFDYERRHGAMPASFRALNPTGQVPVLLVDGVPLCDSTRILAFLDDRSGGALRAHPEGPLHAEEWLLEELADTSLSGFVVAARWADEANWPRVREAYFGGVPAPLRRLVAGRVRADVLRSLHARDVWRGGPEACWTRFRTLLGWLEERAPERGAWLGESFGIADLGLFAMLHSLRTDLTPWQRTQVESHPRLRAYLERVDERTRAPSRVAPRTA